MTLVVLQVPASSVWGFGRPAWDLQSRVYGQRPIRSQAAPMPEQPALHVPVLCGPACRLCHIWCPTVTLAVTP